MIEIIEIIAYFIKLLSTEYAMLKFLLLPSKDFSAHKTE